MAATSFIAAIEIGSSKISGIVGEKNGDGSITIKSYAEEDSQDIIRKGIPYNLDKTTDCLTSLINKLEENLDPGIEQVYVSIGGQSLHAKKNSITVQLDKQTIVSKELVSSIIKENIQKEYSELDILTVVPQEYKLGSDYQVDPVGVATTKIEGNFLNVVAKSSFKKSLIHCFKEADITIADILVNPIANANVILSNSDKRKGCALIDLGAETTTISVYRDNLLRFLAVLPLGGRSITKDIMSLGVEEHEAEELKRNYIEVGLDMNHLEEDEDRARTKYELSDGRSIEVDQLNEIAQARAQEIVENVWNLMQLAKQDSNLLAGIFLIGGGANLNGIDAVFKKTTKIQRITAIKKPTLTIHTTTKLPTDGVSFSLIGNIYLGDKNCCKEQPKPAEDGQGELFTPKEVAKEQENIEVEVKVDPPIEPKTTKGKEKKDHKKKSGGMMVGLTDMFQTLQGHIFPDNNEDKKPKNNN